MLVTAKWKHSVRPVFTTFAALRSISLRVLPRLCQKDLHPAPQASESGITNHGQDGRKPTPIGESMYPRVPNLSCAAVQRMSDRELFWVVKNGIRLSGMPGFGNLDSDQELWQMTYYVRSLGAPVKH